MAVSVPMPRLGESVSEGTVTRWLKQEGEQVEADEPLLEVSTDKVDTEIPAPAAGILQSIKVQEDETVEVGVELAVIGDSADDSSDDSGSGGGEEQDQAEQQDEDQDQAKEQDQDSDADGDAGEQDQAEQQDQADEDDEDEQEESEPEPEPQQASEESSEQERGDSEQSEPEPAKAQQAAPQESSQQQSDGQSDGQAQSDGEAPYVTPLVRRLASEHGVDLSSVSGTGVGGRIRKQDVLDAAASASTRGDGGRDGGQAEGKAESKQQDVQAEDQQQKSQSGASQGGGKAEPAKSTAQARGKTEKLSRLRATIAKRMVESLHVSAQLTTVVEVDVTKIANLRKRAKDAFAEREGVPLSFLPFFAVATCEALKQHPKVNSSIDLDAGTVTYHEAEHLGIAVDTDRGLLVPVIHDAGDLNLGGMARKIADIANRTRSSEIQPDELGGGTFTLTNTGSRGALLDTPIINQPQVGILGTGTVVKRPAVVDDPDLGEVIAVRSIIYLALSYDHRIVDGADAARFLTTIKQRLEEGSFEGDLGL